MKIGNKMKVLASDFDNTLFFRDIEGFHDQDVMKIKSFQEKGNLFGMCSGRPFSGLLKPLKGVLKPDFFIVSTGGAILDKNYQLLYGKKVPFDIVKEIHLTYQKETELIVQTLSQKYFYCSNPRDEEDVVEIHSLDDMKGEDIYSISLVDSTVERAREIVEEINQKYSEVDAYQNVDSVDIVKKGCSKGAAILKLKELLDIKEIAGIGDSYNDLSMLNVVDTSFTFHRSPIDIKKRVHYVVDSIDEAIDIIGGVEK